MKNDHDIRAIALAVVRGIIKPDDARAAVRGRADAKPVCETLRLPPELKAEALDPAKLPSAERKRLLEVFDELYQQPPVDQVLREDQVFGIQLVAQNLAVRHDIEECLAIQRRLAQAGIRPLPRIGDLLVRRGSLSPGKLAESKTARMPGAKKEFVLTETQFDDMASDALEAASKPENVFGKYVRTIMLGQGGMGEVWKAWDKELKRWVALKFLKYDSAEELARFEREAQMAAKLSHPNIASIYDVGQAQGKHYIAMQYVGGQTLANFRRDDVKLLVELVRDAALAVHAAHEQGVVHRDIKPENIMIEGRAGGRPASPKSGKDSRRAQGLRLFVMDFGLAKSLSVDSAVSVSGTIVGTPSYMSPEQAKGSDALDHRSDVYSLGATLYSVLADRPPFRANNAYEILKMVVEEDPRSLRKINGRSDADLETIVMKCLEKDPSRRYRTAHDLADDLSRWLEGEAIAAHPPSIAYRARKFLARRKVLVVAALIALAALALLAALLVPRWLHERRERERAQEENDRLKEARALFDEGRAAFDKARELGRATAPPLPRIRTELNRAVDCFSRAVERAPEMGEAFHYRAGARLQLGQMDAAGRDFESALQRQPDSGAVWGDYGRYLLRRYQSSRGLPTPVVSPHQLEYVEHSGPDDPELRTRCAEAFKRAGESAFAEAALALFDGRHRDTILGLTRLLEKDPYQPELLWYRALGYLGVMDVPLAIADLKSALAMNAEIREIRPTLIVVSALKGDLVSVEDENDSILRVALGNARHCLGQSEEAIDYFKKALQSNRQVPGAHLGLAAVAVDAEKPDYPAIADHLDKELQIDPSRTYARFLRGLVRLHQGDDSGAVAEFTAILKSRTRHPLAAFYRSLAHLRLGHWKEAKEDYVVFMRFGTRWHDRKGWGDAEAKQLLEGIRERAAKELTGSQDVELLALGSLLFRSPKLASQAVALAPDRADIQFCAENYQRSLELGFDDPGIHALLASRAQTSEERIRHYRRAIELDPYAGVAYYNLGDELDSRRDFDGAKDLFLKATYFYDESWAHGMLAALYYIRCQNPEFWKECLAKASKPPVLFERRAGLCRVFPDPEELLRVVEEARALGITTDTLRADEAWALLQKGNTEAALRTLKSVRIAQVSGRQNPRNVLTVRAWLLLLTGDRANAIADVEALSAIIRTQDNVDYRVLRAASKSEEKWEPKDPIDFAGTAVLSLAIARYAEAATSLSRALEGRWPDETRAVLLELRGRALLRLGRNEEAEKDLTAAIELRPSSAACYLRGMARRGRDNLGFLKDAGQLSKFSNTSAESLVAGMYGAHDTQNPKLREYTERSLLLFQHTPSTEDLIGPEGCLSKLLEFLR